jgi:exodeoxyribonuclease VIII
MNYHEHPALSASKLKTLVLGTPRDYWARYLDPDRQAFKPSDAMRQGSLVDAMLTQTAEMPLLYVVAPDCDRRTKAGKEIWAEAQDRAVETGGEVISREWYENGQRIADMLSRDGITKESLDGSGQNPHFWNDAEFGTSCRYMPDCEIPSNGLLVDLKKSRSPEPRAFQRQAYALGYDIQMAHYSEGYRDRYGEYPERCVLLAYQWDWPHNYSVNVLTADMLEEGRRRREEGMAVLRECYERDTWPSWGVVDMDAPRWLNVDDPANKTDADNLELEGLE